MIARLLFAAMLFAPVTGCSDPLDDEPKGQSIPTHADLTTRYAAGASPAASGMAPSSAMAGPSANGEGGADPQPMAQGGQNQDQSSGLVSRAGAGGGAATGGAVPPAGLQTAPDGQAEGGRQSGASGQGGTSGASSGGTGG